MFHGEHQPENSLSCTVQVQRGLFPPLEKGRVELDNSKVLGMSGA
jgi:hypothetical protein